MALRPEKTLQIFSCRFLAVAAGDVTCTT